jgi:rhamnose transport system permease protein
MKGFLKSWEGLLLVILAIIIAVNVALIPEFLSVRNQVNLLVLSGEKIIVALIMTYIIISAEIDLSVASVMGLSACVFGTLFNNDWDAGTAIAVCLAVGATAGAFNAFWITYVGIPSLVATLAMLIGFRGFARVLLEDNGINGFPDWFTGLARDPFLGPLPFSLTVFFVLLAILAFVLHRTKFGREVFVIGNNAEMARYAGVNVAKIKTIIFMLSGLISALAGLFYASRLASVRGDAALGFELDIITMVLMGGVSIFGGKGSMLGVLLSMLIVLNLRNGMSLLNVDGHRQTAVIGILLIASVLIPYLIERARRLRTRNSS